MPSTKISALSDGSVAQATDEFIIARSGANYRVDGASVAAAATSVGTLTGLTVSGNITVGDKLIHDGDTNTAIRFPAVDTVTVETSGSERMRVAANGYVGVGTTNPLQPFHVDGISLVSNTATGNAVQAFLQSGVYEWSIGQRTNTNFVFNNGGNFAGTDRLTLTGAGNLGLNATPSAWSTVDWRAIENNYGQSVAFDQNFPNLNLVANAFYDTSWKYKISDSASRYVVEGAVGNHAWYSAPAGTSGNAITWTNTMTLSASANLGLGTTTFGTNAAKVLALGTGTEPSSGPADTVQLYSVDLSAGNTIPAVRCEGTGVTGAGITNTTVTHKIALKVNGTVYYLLATTNNT